MSLNYQGHIDDESARFYEVLSQGDPDAMVPTCEGWRAADLLWHLGEVQHFWAAIVGQRLRELSTYDRPARPAQWSDLQAFFLATNHALLAALAGVDDDEPVWTWFESQRNVAFVRRRQAHEALIHRLDAELTTGSVTPLDPVLASDGVLEVVNCIFGGLASWATRTAEGPIGQLTASDTGDAWLIRVDEWAGTSPDSGAEYHDESILELVEDGTATFEVVGTAADLDAWLWNRPAVAQIQVRGDADELLAIVERGVA